MTHLHLLLGVPIKPHRELAFPIPNNTQIDFDASQCVHFKLQEELVFSTPEDTQTNFDVSHCAPGLVHVVPSL